MEKAGVLDDFGPQNSAPGDLNQRGELLVEYLSDGLGYRTGVYRDGTLTDLPRAGGQPVFGPAINDAGWVTGYFTGADGRNFAFIWDGETYKNLTQWSGNSVGLVINNLGQVVGVADNRAFLYADGELIDLNTRIDRSADLSLISADEINDRTQILSQSCDRAGVFCYASVLLNPVPAVPELSAIAMLLGWAGLGWAWQVRIGCAASFGAAAPVRLRHRSRRNRLSPISRRVCHPAAVRPSSCALVSVRRARACDDRVSRLPLVLFISV